MDIKIEPMELDSIEKVLEISELSFPIPWSRKSFEQELSNVFANYFVAKSNDEVIGYGGMWIIIDEGHITNIAVHPKYRNQGVGDKILSKMIATCNEKKVIAMTLEVRSSNLAAQKLYSKYGFISEGIRKKYYEDNGEDAIIMWKRW
ncbi:ribosomal protein S18-alanine N-acetyltransferase [Clostridium manihotivorum]|uniref:[Ribosomal protein bS18]-alanine N-acetyltransferase n=1 Tax=Clostridium manihotivorum TaxID=2320868 RepID=A0A3R5U4H2_9CLOT|nr:ribosomal protein S18-alanine N-acetyltransferase [Clostridium manihotivorum]QAA31460.1 ribosomal-protein-alanine N-acetyltransferase [Clostridium manihotivorum]